jgi:hypothetical protein
VEKQRRLDQRDFQKQVVKSLEIKQNPVFDMKTGFLVQFTAGIASLRRTQRHDVEQG